MVRKPPSKGPASVDGHTGPTPPSGAVSPPRDTLHRFDFLSPDIAPARNLRGDGTAAGVTPDTSLPASTVTISAVTPPPDFARAVTRNTLPDYALRASVQLPEADAHGLRSVKGRGYAEVSGGDIVPVATDPQTGLYRARLESERFASGPALERDPVSGQWAELSEFGSGASRSASPRIFASDKTVQLKLSAAHEVEFNGAKYFAARSPDAGDGQHYLLRVRDPQKPSELLSSGIIATPDAAGTWHRRGRKGGMKAGHSDEEFELALESLPTRSDSPDDVFELASESMPIKPYTPEELSSMRHYVRYSGENNKLGSYNRANNGKYPIRGIDGKPMYVRSIEPEASMASGNRYTSEQVLPYLKAGGFEQVARLYEEKLQLRTFTEADIIVPGEKALIGQSMVVANRRISKGEIIGVYGGDLVPAARLSLAEQTFAMYATTGTFIEDGRPREFSIVVVGDNIVSRINTNFVFNAAGRPLRQSPGGYNVETVAFRVDAEDRSGGEVVRRGLELSTVFATTDIPAGKELRLNYHYSREMVALLFPAP
ncbi:MULTISPECIES: hypothetical protein [unclassified Pseudomonas]|uniref:hypothetical protein n=1 Tax=unclassified Pseudomonas TaxID=196821 RepID=UPI0030D83A18